MTVRSSPQYASRNGCWRRDRFVEFTVRGKHGVRYDIHGQGGGRSVLIDYKTIGGDTPMQRAMFVRRIIDVDVDRMRPIQSRARTLDAGAVLKEIDRLVAVNDQYRVGVVHFAVNKELRDLRAHIAGMLEEG